MAGAPAASELPPLHGAKLAIVAVALALGTFMQVLDTTIANVSLPTIAGNLGVSSDNSTWVITAFAVANGACVPLTGWLMGRFGVVRTFCFSVAAFTIASFLCGIAWNLSSLIVFRVLQGAVSGPMIPGSQALLLSIFPAEKRSTGLGLWSMTAMVGPICGPVLGGYISDNYHWGWIFLINVPVGIICAGICWSILRNRETPTRKLPIDVGGLLLLFLWVGALQVMLDLGKDDDWFNATRIVILGLTALIGLIAWLIWELTAPNPVVDLTLFKSRNFLFATVCFCLAYAVMFGNLLLMPLWMQTQLGYNATWAGIASMPSGAVAVVLTPLVARIANKVDARILATISLAAFAGGYYLRSELTSTASFYQFVIPMLVQGIGMSMFFMGFITIAFDGIPPHKVPSAAGLQNFLRITAGGFAASITTTAWDRRETLHQSRLVEAMGQGPILQQAMTTLQHSGMSAAQAAGGLMRQVIGQAYLLASVDLFRLSAWASIVLIAFVWITRRPAPPSGPIAAD